MVQVRGVTVEEIDFQSRSTDEFKKCLELVPELRSLLPKRPKHKVRFELTDTTSALANGIVRCLKNEIPTKSLYFEHAALDTSDLYILHDFLLKQVCLIPIHQAVDYSLYDVSLRAENKSDEIIEVTTRDIVIKPKKDAPALTVHDIMSDVIVICLLRPDEHLYITKIGVREGVGRDDPASFLYVGNVYYRPLIEPLDAAAGTGVSSLASDPREFMIGYSTMRNLDDQMAPVVAACGVLISGLDAIEGAFAGVSDDMDYHYSDMIQVETKHAMREVHIKNKGWTFTNLIARYCYMLDGSIEFCAASNLHHEKDIGVVKIIHREFATLIKDAIKAAKKDIYDVLAQVS